jgi:hypothetical protein
MAAGGWISGDQRRSAAISGDQRADGGAIVATR